MKYQTTIALTLLSLMYPSLSVAQDSGSSTVIINRNSNSLIGSSCLVDVYFDGNHEGTLKHKESLRINTTGGNHDITAEIAGSNCKFKPETIVFKVNNDQRKYYDLTFMKNEIKLLPTKVK